MPDPSPDPTTVEFGGLTFSRTRNLVAPVSSGPYSHQWICCSDGTWSSFTAAIAQATAAQEENERLRVLISEIDGICSDDASCLTVIGRRPCREIEAAITRFRDREAEQ